MAEIKKGVGFIFLMILASCTSTEVVVWELDNMEDIGGYQPRIIGDPESVSLEGITAISFDGEGDGLVLPVNPVEGYERFTIEVLFRPDSDGPEEQRFVHFQDEKENRGLIETRINENGNWALDTFLYNKSTDNGLTLLARSNNHPGDTFYWAALVYDGTTMSHYVNGMKELEGDIEFGPMGPGEISLGMRLNRVHWFKGMIREIRFHPAVVDAEDLQKTRN